MINVSPSATNPSHHIKLVDKDSTELGLICADAQGDRVSRVSVNPYPAMASQLRQGRGKYSDRTPPFEEIGMEDFSGGLGSLHFDNDKLKYYDGQMADTSKAGRAICAGMPHLTTGISDNDENSWCDSVDWTTFVDGVTDSVTTSFVASASYNLSAITLILRSSSSTAIPAIAGDDLEVSLLDNADAVLKSKTMSTQAIELVSNKATFTFSSVQAVTAGTTYKVKIERKAYVFSETIKVATDSSDDLIFRTHDDTDDFSVLPFEYRGGFYCITQPEDRSNSGLYQLGTHGLAAANTGALTRLNDATKDFSSSGYNVNSGDLVKIVTGPGSEEDQPWRTATSGSNGYITVSPAWTVEHTVNTEYVVITDEWEQIDVNNDGAKKDFDFYVTGVCVTDRVIHLGAGSDDYHHRLRFGNDDGTWTIEGVIDSTEASEIWRADKLLPIRHNHHKSERPVFDLFVSRKMDGYQDRNYLNNIMKLRTPTFWGSPYQYLGQLTDNRPWLGNEYTNVDSYADRGWAAIEWNATFTTGSIAAKTLDPPVDMSEAEMILFSMYSDTAITAGHLTLTLGDGSDEWVLDFPAIKTDDDMFDNIYWYEISLHALNTAPTGSDFPDLTKIDRLLIKVATDQNAVVKLKLGQEGMLLANRNPNNERYELGLTEYVTNMIEYGGGAGQVTRKPWIGTNKNLYYIEGGVLKPIYLKEIEELEHYRNCELMEVNDVYLYFNQGGKIQRYYSGKLDNVGPDVDDGLINAKQGIPCTGATYPGRIYVGIDAGTGALDYSSVMFRKNHGWHEVYRGLAGDAIKKIHIVARPDTTDRMYISAGKDIIWVPVSLDPENDSDYEYNYEFVIETGRVYAGLRDTQKYFHALKLVGENIESAGPYFPAYGEFEVDYRTWDNYNYTTIGTSYTSDVQEVEFDSTNNDTEGEYIQFRIRGYTTQSSESPVLVAAVLKSLERLDVNNTYSYTVELKEGTTNDLAGFQETQTGVEKLTQLETWVDSPLPLTLNTCSEFENDKLVFLEGVRKRVLYHIVDDKEQEIRLADLTLIEVS